MTAAFAFTSRDDDRYETKSAASATVHTGHFAIVRSKTIPTKDITLLCSAQ